MSPEELTEAERRFRPDFVAGAPRGKPMAREQAGGPSSNPRFHNKNAGDEGYWDNCQSCVVSYIMRLRGYDVEAKNRDYNNDAQNLLSENITLAWIDPDTNNPPKPTIVPPRNHRDGLRWLEENLENGAYLFVFRWVGTDERHVIIIEDIDGSLEMYDPLRGEMINKNKQMEYMKSIAWGRKFRPKVLRADLMEPNLDIVDRVLKPKVKE